MAYNHTKNTVVKVGSASPPTTDISAYVKDSSVDRKRKSHDVTGYGVSDEAAQGGLRKNTAKLKVFWNVTLHAILQPLEALDVVYFIIQPAGAGTGNPQLAFSGFFTNQPWNMPVSAISERDYDIEINGAVTETTL